MADVLTGLQNDLAVAISTAVTAGVVLGTILAYIKGVFR